MSEIASLERTDRALRDAYDGLRERAPIRFERFAQAFAGWRIVPVHGGAVLISGNEVHVSVRREARGRWLSRSLVRTILGGLVDRYGVARTTVAQENKIGRAFVQRLGFVQTGIEGEVVSYELRQIRHA